jgi:glycosyltransferase involved in cell wall biosynthesis
MYAGAHGVANGLDNIVDAASLLKKEDAGTNIRILFIGSGPSKQALEERVRREELTNVTFEAPVPKHSIHRKMQQADAFLMNLEDSPVFRWGVSPNKLFDYMSSARPVIFSVRTPFNPIETAQAGISIPPNDGRALADAMLQMAALPVAERWEMGLRGRRYVEENHGFVQLGERLERALLQQTKELR